ncbi:hypothetical protein WN51_07690 [Melipona quadrifasciata]|uniref:Uncharacterized protein n=1 Tax=Melipona quadrifasciata TaxID=166423 RepID=A0A0N0BIW1_9HYME|nr:hypothetical protein WN51_07690 [Melipona quadrifasciata]
MPMIAGKSRSRRESRKKRFKVAQKLRKGFFAGKTNLIENNSETQETFVLEKHSFCNNGESG